MYDVQKFIRMIAYKMIVYNKAFQSFHVIVSH